MLYKTLMAEFEAEFKGKEDVNSVWAKRKHFMGVTKNGNRWQARIRNPKLKTDVYLGSYSTPEEAALVVKNKKAEFEAEFKDKDGLGIKRRCGNVFQRRKLPCGVTRHRGKYRVRIWHPELKNNASFGYYSTCDEAAVVADRKRAELRELYGGKRRGGSEHEGDDKVLQEAAVVTDRKRKRKRKWAELREVYRGKVRGSGECEDDDEEVLQETTSSDEQASDVKDPARIKDPVSDDRIWLGSYETLADAIRRYRKEKTVLGTKMKKAEFEEKFMGKEDVNIVENETCDGVSAKRKHLFGVSKKGDKWQARIRHPKLKVTVHLGYYSTPEEAALVVKTKKAEFEDMLKSEDGLRMRRRCGDEFQGRKLPFGVRSQSGKFRVRVWHPGLKKFASFGYYSTCDEAAVVAKRKRAELQGLYGGKLRGSSEREDRKRKRAELREVYGRKARGIGVCEDDDEEVLQETESLEAAGVANRKRKRKMAKLSEVYGGKVRGSGECEDDDEEVLQEATSEVAGKFECSDEQEKTVLDTKMKRAEFEERYKGKEDVNIVEDDFCDGGSDGLNNFETSDKLNCCLVDVPDKLECEFVHGSCTSNIEVGTSNSACVGDKRVIDQMSQRKTTCSLDFDEAVNAGFINEYGQLMGKYRELDEQLYLGLPEENVAACR